MSFWDRTRSFNKSEMLLQAPVSSYTSKIVRVPADGSGGSGTSPGSRFHCRDPNAQAASVLGDGDRTDGKKRRLRWRREKRMGPESPDKGPLMWVN